MAWRYTGISARLLPQYIDLATWKALAVSPGGVYDMQPVPALDGKVPVPPDSVNWEPADPAEPPAEPPAETAADVGPEDPPAAEGAPPPMSSPSAEDEHAAQ